MNAPMIRVASARTRHAAAILAAVVLSSCGAADQGGEGVAGTDRADPAAAPSDVSQPSSGAASLSPDGVGGDVLAFAESLVPPGGVERARITDDGTTQLRWSTAEPVEAVEAHYEAMDRDLGLVLAGSVAGATSWVFVMRDGVPANGSIQLTPTGAEEVLVTVTLDPGT